METQLYINCFLAGVVGMLFHLIAYKIPALKRRAKVANVSFEFKEYLKDDWMSLLATIMSIGILVWFLDEIVGYNPSFLRIAKFFFLFVGYTGSSVLISILGRFDKKVEAIVDYKTDKLDDLTGGSNENIKG